MNRFDYLEARSLREACSLLERYGPEARLFAGGTDVLIRWRQGSWKPRYVINLKTIPNLDRLTCSPRGGLRFGALTRVRALELHPGVRSRYSAMTAAATSFAGLQIRNLATVGGNVCNASPAGDTLPALLAFRGEVRVVGQGAQRWVPLEEFFLGPGRTALGLGELVAEFRFPPVPQHTGSIYIKHSPRKAMDIATVGVASVVTLDARTRACRAVTIALGAVGPTPFRARRAEAALEGQRPEPRLLAEAARLAADEARPINDIRDSAAHRKAVVEALVSRALRHAVQAAERNSPEEFETIRDISVEAVRSDTL